VTANKLAEAREQFVLMVAYACAIENCDAHLKNFSVLYAQPEAEITLALEINTVDRASARWMDRNARYKTRSLGLPSDRARRGERALEVRYCQ
jgi:hypothetical protein